MPHPASLRLAFYEQNAYSFSNAIVLLLLRAERTKYFLRFLLRSSLIIMKDEGYVRDYDGLIDKFIEKGNFVL